MRLAMDGGHGEERLLPTPRTQFQTGIIRRYSFAISPQVCARFDPEFSAI
jgi:hypothetical protein